MMLAAGFPAIQITLIVTSQVRFAWDASVVFCKKAAFINKPRTIKLIHDFLLSF